MRVWRRFRRKKITKPQAKEEGEKVLRDARARMMEITRKWFAKNGLVPTEPETTDELDAFTQDKIEEWNLIVDDM